MRLSILKSAAMLVFASLATVAEARPKAERGEPEIIKDGEDLLGRDRYRQSFIGSSLASGPITLSIAESYHMFGGGGGVNDAVRVRVRCNILPSGYVPRTECKSLASPESAGEKAYNAARAARAIPPLPRFRELAKWTGSRLLGNDWAHYRNLEFDLDIPAFPLPEVDLSRGRLVERTLIPVGRLFRRVAQNYPSRALRQELEGNLTAQCQIQMDFSTICTEIEFDPPEHLQIFKRSFLRQIVKAKAEPTLKDGSDARGVRFEMGFVYRIR